MYKSELQPGLHGEISSQKEEKKNKKKGKAKNKDLNLLGDFLPGR